MLEISECRFVPGTRDVASQRRSMDIMMLPSRSEALANSLMEAMACGCCAVAARVGGNPELIDDGHTGLLPEAGNAGDLAEKLATLVEHSSRRRSLARWQLPSFAALSPWRPQDGVWRQSTRTCSMAEGSKRHWSIKEQQERGDWIDFTWHAIYNGTQSYNADPFCFKALVKRAPGDRTL